MNNYENIGIGLRKMYVATIGTLVCTLLSSVPLVNILFAIGILVFCVINLQGYYYVGKDISAGQAAFVLQIITICLSLANTFDMIPNGLKFLYTIAAELIPFLAICIVYHSVCKILRAKGADEVARQGNIALCLQLASAVITVLASAMVFAGAILGALLISLIFSIVTLIYTLKFLKNSATEFGVYF